MSRISRWMGTMEPHSSKNLQVGQTPDFVHKDPRPSAFSTFPVDWSRKRPFLQRKATVPSSFCST
jgi:hypothetical protein